MFCSIRWLPSWSGTLKLVLVLALLFLECEQGLDSVILPPGYWKTNSRKEMLMPGSAYIAFQSKWEEVPFICTWPAASMPEVTNAIDDPKTTANKIADCCQTIPSQCHCSEISTLQFYSVYIEFVEYSRRQLQKPLLRKSLHLHNQMDH